MSDERRPLPPVADGSRALSQTVLRWVKRKNLQVPAAILLEMHRPLMPLAWSIAVLFGGILAPLFGPDYYDKIEVLREPGLIDRILRSLEAPPEEDGNGKDGSTKLGRQR